MAELAPPLPLGTAGRRPGFHRLRVAARVIVAVVGGYFATAAMVTSLSVTLPVLTHLSRGEAVVLSSMLGFIGYLVLLLWSFAERKLSRLLITFLLIIVAGHATSPLLHLAGVG